MGTRGNRIVAALAAGSLVAAACSGDDATNTSSAATTTTIPATNTSNPTTSSTTTTTLPPLAPADDVLLERIHGDVDGAPAGCDPLDPRQCVLPFPSDAYASADTSTESGRRVAFPADGLPANAGGVHIDPTVWNRADGFSANTPILTFVAELDPEASALPSWIDLGASLADDATVVLVDTSTGERIALWAEPDADAADPSGQLLTIRPAVSLAPATTYAVGLRGLVTTAGEPVASSATFTAYRDRLDTEIPDIEARRDDMEVAFTALDRVGVRRSDLQLAWTFTTASTDAVTAEIVHMRDQTLAGLGSFSPEYEITNITLAPEEGIARYVEGTYSVPNYLTGDGGPGTALARGDDGLPVTHDITKAPFACVVADAVVAGDAPAHLVLYGHGLLGSHHEVDAGNIVAMANEHGALYCATKWAGFSEDDIPTAIAALQDLSSFPIFTDRMLQGFVNQLVLGRLLLAHNGLVVEPAFHWEDGERAGDPLYDRSTIVYDGNSQGGIMGMALVALSPDIERAVLGVVGMNYSTLLPRSVDFDAFETIFVPAYPSGLDRAIALGVIQMVWDRAEGAGYVRHLIDDPLPGSTRTDTLMHVAFGDWQVSELTAMVAARTAGIPIHRPVTAEGRSHEVDGGWGIDTLDYGAATSGLVVWDSGSDPIPIAPIPPSKSRDPHGDPRNDVEVRRQKAAFLFDGELIDVCGGAACTAAAR